VIFHRAKTAIRGDLHNSGASQRYMLCDYCSKGWCGDCELFDLADILHCSILLQLIQGDLKTIRR
jgi:hypothetical protein